MPSKSILRAGYTAAIQSEHSMKVGAVLFKGGSIIRTACNNTKISSQLLKYNEYGTRHAEMNVLNNMPLDVLRGMSLMVVRVNRKGLFTCSKPCKSCFSKLLDLGINRVFYTDYSGEIVKLKMQYIEDYRKDLPLNWRVN
jgi:deoxycytidylate deaminase